ncbi:alpha/beta hydrolase [Mesobacillus subterraneus]|uniref:Alpha/beta hydrolase n=1 Tax=Mesobacillus subterraneus TaxID=285983 RepID=A0A427TWE9_9BACI|nr:alpha/beta hydrolase-fold protein [Mesobacillus subterraneus]RSD28680.1 alpha/beta hydrolase [Mesobacillus subterraneus]
MIENLTLPLFGEERKIRVYLPADYAGGSKQYPVLYMHDGQNVFGSEDAIGGISLELHEYLDDNKVNLIVVAIDQKSEERMNEYCPWEIGEYSAKLTGEQCSDGGKGKEYIKWVAEELKPFIDEQYRTDRAETYMAGISLGSLITTYAVCVYPQVFKRIAGLSSAYFRNYEGITALLKESNLSHLDKVYLDCGTMEGGKQIAPGFLQSNIDIYELIKQKGIQTEFKTIQDAKHHYSDFKKRFPEVMNYLIS